MGSSSFSKMSFTRFVETGRVAMINYGKDEGKLVAIVDVVDHSQCLVYGPPSGVARQLMSYKRLSLTDNVVENLRRGARKGNVEKLWAAAGVEDKWAQTGWGKKQAARKAKASCNDFDRFKAMVGRKTRNAKARAA